MAHPRPDRVLANKDGTIALRISGTDFMLRRPRIGENRDISSRIQELVDAQTAIRAEYTNTETGALNDGMEQRDLDEQLNNELLDYWRWLIELLERDGKKLEEPNDELSDWLCNAQLVTEFRSHWREVPWGPGGSPTAQQAKTAGAQMASVLPALQALAPMLGAAGNDATD